jgi:hypothetical protein
MEIEEKIIQETIHCKRNFECLKADNESFRINGTLERSLDGKVHIIYCNKIICHYRMNFGKYTICNCPTRNEKYRMHKK